MKKFRKIYIEIGNVCNLNCSFCKGHRRGAKLMSAAEFETVLEKTKAYGDNFYLHLMGEPLFHPQISEFLQIAKKAEISLNITTNGTLLMQNKEILRESGVRMISVSLHSFEANDIDISLFEYLQNILDFCKYMHGSETIIELRLWNETGENKMNDEILKYIENFFKLNFSLHEKLQEFILQSKDRNRRKQNIKIEGKVFLGSASHFEWPDIEKADGVQHSGFCYGLRNQIAILANGQVSACCLDSDGAINLGNIYTQTPEEIINGTAAREIYTGFTNRKAVHPLCGTCGYMRIFFEKSH